MRTREKIEEDVKKDFLVKHQLDKITKQLCDRKVTNLLNIPGIGSYVIESLERNGFKTLFDVYVRKNQLSNILGIGEKTRSAIIRDIDRIIETWMPKELPDTAEIREKIDEEINRIIKKEKDEFDNKMKVVGIALLLIFVIVKISNC